MARIGPLTLQSKNTQHTAIGRTRRLEVGARDLTQRL
jgi:hypothetical protein